MGSITQDPKFDYRQEFTQYLRLEKESVYNVETTLHYIINCVFKTNLGPQCYRHKETTPAVWTAGLQGKICIFRVTVTPKLKRVHVYIVRISYIYFKDIIYIVKISYIMLKGSKNIAVSRSFVNYIANSEISRHLRVTFLIIIICGIVIPHHHCHCHP